MVCHHVSAFKYMRKSPKDFLILLMLHYTKLGKHLPADRHFRLTVNGYMEASFTVDETDDPVWAWPFLLIGCNHTLSPDGLAYTFYAQLCPVVA